MTETMTSVPDPAPPRVLNACMVGFLKIPGLQRMIGKSVALISFTGTKSGLRYSFPVSYSRDGDTVTILTDASRRWWRNLVGGVPVGLRLAGIDRTGTADAHVGDAGDEPAVAAFLTGRSMDAKAHGIRLDDAGVPDPTGVRDVTPRLVVVTVRLG